MMHRLLLRLLTRRPVNRALQQPSGRTRGRAGLQRIVAPAVSITGLPLGLRTVTRLPFGLLRDLGRSRAVSPRLPIQARSALRGRRPATAAPTQRVERAVADLRPDR